MSKKSPSFHSTNLQAANEVISTLRSLGNPAALEGMARYGINTRATFGTSLPKIRERARELKQKNLLEQNHRLAQQLWKTGIREARLLASMIEDPMRVTELQMEAWVSDFDSWDVCDGCCGELFDKTPYAYLKAKQWSKKRKEEYVKRAGFVLMAELAVHDKKAADSPFIEFLKIIELSAGDERNFVKKAVNWALRQIGKRNSRLQKLAIETARKIHDNNQSSKAAKWVAADALRELTSLKQQTRMKKVRGM